MPVGDHSEFAETRRRPFWPGEVLHNFTLYNMKLSPDTRRNWIVIAAFGGFILSVFAISFVISLLPSFEQKCIQQCKPRGLEGRMVPKYSREMTGARGGPLECKCFSAEAHTPTP